MSEKSSHRGRPQKLTRSQQKWLLKLIESEPTLYLDELALRVSLHTSNPIDASSICRYLGRHRMTRKRLTTAARERRDDLRWNFTKRMADQAVRPEQLVFVDEMSKDERTVQRLYGWGVKGDAVEVSLPFVRGQRYSVLAAVSWESGVVSHSHVEDSYTMESFLAVRAF